MVITRPWTKLIFMFNEDETCTLLVHGLGFSSKHSSMDFLVHGLDMHYALRRPLYGRVCLGLIGLLKL